MKRKLYWLRAAKILSLVLAVALCVALLQVFVFREYGHNSMRIEGFYDQPKNSLDVVLIGQSSVYSDYSPGYAYDQYGFTSYSCAIASNSVSTWKILTEEILKRQDPQLIVVDVGGTHYLDLEHSYKTSVVHQLFDYMPLSGSKIRGIDKLVTHGNGEDILEYYVPLTFYHDRWTDLGESLTGIQDMISWRLYSRGVLRGNYTRTETMPTRVKQYDVTNDYETSDLAPYVEEYLREYLDFCREKDLNVLFVCFPYRVTDQGESYNDFHRLNRTGEIVQEYGYDFVNFAHLVDEIGIDFTTDLYNDNHLNVYGQLKMTDYLCSLLVDEYGVHGHELTPRQREDWDKTAAYIEAYYDYAVELADAGEKVNLIENQSTIRAVEERMGES